MQHFRSGPSEPWLGHRTWGWFSNIHVHICDKCICVWCACSEHLWRLREGSEGGREKTRILCLFSHCPAVKTSAEQKRIKFPERKPTSNPVIPLIERTCAGPPRSLSVKKQKFFRSPRTCQPPCAAKLWQGTLASAAYLCCVHSLR